MKVRPAFVVDAGALAVLHALCFREAYDPPWSMEQFRRALAHEGALGFVVEDQSPCLLGGVLGYTAPESVDILTLAVHPAVQRRGIARILIDRVRRAESTKTCFVEVAEPNQSARLFYQAYGFQQVGLRKGYYRASGAGNRVNALVLSVPPLDLALDG